jgi:hypothetical protein
MDHFFQPRTINHVKAEDFQVDGRFFGLKLPFFTPIPQVFLDYIYGAFGGGSLLGSRAAMCLLKHLHHLNGTKTEWCGCGTHLFLVGYYTEDEVKKYEDSIDEIDDSTSSQQF